MKYEIRNNNDFVSGSHLFASIPENEVDYYALNTLRTDCPNFILPFSYKSIDGQVELTYKIGVLSKLLYFSGNFPVEEYVELWISLLEPLVECRDWFMNPYSFVLNIDNLFFDKHKRKARYLYIPSIHECSNHASFHSLALDFSKLITVSDANLENKVLRAIMAASSPADIIKMLKDYSANNDMVQQYTLQNDTLFGGTLKDEAQFPIAEREQSARKDTVVPIEQPAAKSPDDSFYDAAYSDSNAEPYVFKKESAGLKMFSGWSKRKKGQHQGDENKNAVDKSVDSSAYQPPKPVIAMKVRNSETTQSTPVIDSGTGLKYIGVADFPEVIQVKIAQGDIFTIGRFDSAVGKKQSNFEFDRKTKAVSRRHAVIERDVNGYKIIDLTSSAGTFVNSERLPPNTPYGLKAGARISFGNLGADYVWEVS